jgi:hypothetical protein
VQDICKCVDFKKYQDESVEDTAFFMKGGYYMVNQKRVISE